MPIGLESNVYLQRNDTSCNILALLQTLLGVGVVPLAIQKRLVMGATLGSNVLGGRHQDGRSGDGRIHHIFPHRCSCSSCCDTWSLFVCRSHLLSLLFSSLRLSCLFPSVLSSLGFLSLAQLAMANLPLSPCLLPALSYLLPTRLKALVQWIWYLVSPTLNVNPTLFVTPCYDLEVIKLSK